ncbi:MAG: isochorismatase family protein [Pseudomonadota bacterium]
METLSLNPARCALILIDLQNSNLARQLAPHAGTRVVDHCARLAQALRARAGTVVYVRVLVEELLALPADAPLGRPAGAPPPGPLASQLVPEAGVHADDVLIVKRQWGAFYGTELDQILRRRHIDTLVLGGIATNFGVESTARAAFDLGYKLVFAEDAMSGVSAEAHQFACQRVFPHIGRVRSTDSLLRMLDGTAGSADRSDENANP